MRPYRLSRIALTIGAAIFFALAFAATPAFAHDDFCSRDCRAHHIHVYADDPLIRDIVRDIHRIEDRIFSLERRRDEARRYHDGRDVRRFDDDIRDSKHDLDNRHKELRRLIDDIRRNGDRGRDRNYRDRDNRDRDRERGGRDWDNRDRWRN